MLTIQTKEQRTAAVQEMRQLVQAAEAQGGDLEGKALKRFNDLEEGVKAYEAIKNGTKMTSGKYSEETNPEQRAAKQLGRAIINAIQKETGRELRDLKSGDVTGVLQDPQVQAEVIQKLISNMPFQALGADMQVGNNVRNFARYPKVDTLPGVQWVGTEGTQLTDDTTYSWGYVDMDFYTLATNVVKVSMQLMEDSEIDMAAQIGDDILRAISNEVTRRVIDGATGSNQPNGILNQSNIITVPAGGTDLSAIGTRDVFVDAIEALLNRNVPLERIGFLMSPEAGAQWMKTLDTTNQPLNNPGWLQSIIEGGRLQFTTGIQDTFGGGSNEVRIIIGDFSNLVIRGKQVTLALQERYADSLQFGFIGYSRWSWAVKRPDFAVITGLQAQTT